MVRSFVEPTAGVTRTRISGRMSRANASSPTPRPSNAVHTWPRRTSIRPTSALSLLTTRTCESPDMQIICKKSTGMKFIPIGVDCAPAACAMRMSVSSAMGHVTRVVLAAPGTSAPSLTASTSRAVRRRSCATASSGAPGSDGA